MVLGIAGNQVQRMHPRGFIEATVEGGGWLGGNGGKFALDLSRADLEEGNPAVDARITAVREEQAFRRRIRPRPVHEPDKLLFVAVGVQAIGCFVVDPFCGGLGRQGGGQCQCQEEAETRRKTKQEAGHGGGGGKLHVRCRYSLFNGVSP